MGHLMNTHQIHAFHCIFQFQTNVHTVSEQTTIKQTKNEAKKKNCKFDFRFDAIAVHEERETAKQREEITI